MQSFEWKRQERLEDIEKTEERYLVWFDQPGILYYLQTRRN